MKKAVKRSFMEHFQAFYFLVEPNLEADAHIWSGLTDLRELVDPFEFENTVRQAYREFRGRLKLGWGEEVDEMIQKNLRPRYRGAALQGRLRYRPNR